MAARGAAKESEHFLRRTDGIQSGPNPVEHFSLSNAFITMFEVTGTWRLGLDKCGTLRTTLSISSVGSISLVNTLLNWERNRSAMPVTELTSKSTPFFSLRSANQFVSADR